MTARAKRGTALAAAALTAYVAAYAAASMRAKPAADMAFFVYSENPAVDGFCARFFLPAYSAHRAVWRAMGRPFVRYDSDRTAPAGASAPL